MRRIALPLLLLLPVFLSCAGPVAGEDAPADADTRAGQVAPAAVASTTPVEDPAPAPVLLPLPAPVQVLEGTLSEYSIYLPQLTAKTGTVQFLMTNTGTRRHNLRVVGPGVDAKTRDLRGGQSGRVDVLFEEPGPYEVYCDLADHPERGMLLTFNIEP